MTLALLSLLAAAATAFVLQPIFGKKETWLPAAAAPDRAALRLHEKRDQLLLALAELDFERDAGKIGAREHRARRSRLLAEAARATAELDALAGTGVGARAGRGRRKGRRR